MSVLVLLLKFKRVPNPFIWSIPDKIMTPKRSLFDRDTHLIIRQFDHSKTPGFKRLITAKSAEKRLKTSYRAMNIAGPARS